jgi:HK97 family phage major capsid protein
VITNADGDAKQRLTSIREQKNALRDRLKDAREEVAAAREQLADEPTKRSGTVVARALNRQDEIQSQITDLSEEERGLLVEISGGQAPDGGGASFLGDSETLAMLSQMSSSKMPVGRVNLGQYQSREDLVSSLGQGVQAAIPDTDTTSAMRSAGLTRIVPQLRRPLRLLDLIPSAPMDTGSFDYVQETGTYHAAETAEGAMKPGTQAVFTDAEAKAETIASYTKLKKQALADVPALEGVVRSRLAYGVLLRVENQILAGDGPGSAELQGITTMTGIGSVPFSASELPADQALEGIVDVLLSDAVPNAIVANPRDWANALKEKATAGDNKYYSGGPFLATASQLWEVPVIPTKAIPQGSFLVGDFALGATLFVREAVQVIASDSDSDDFTRNRVTLLGEGRFAVAIWQPSAFAVVDLAA